MAREHFSDVRIEVVNPLHVACYRAVSESPETDAMEVLRSWLHGEHLAAPVRNFGFDVEVTPEQQAAGLRGYEVWMTVPPDVPVTGGVTLYDFPGGLYAAMTIREPFGDPFTWIPAGWQRLHQWVTDSPAYRATSGQCLEEVVVGEDHRDLVIYCPVTVAVPEPI